MASTAVTRSSTRTRILGSVIVVAGVLALTACAPGGNPEANTGPDPAGFLLGLWHGLIIVITFIISLFNSDVGIYEVQNNGGWYNFGYVLGISIAFGGVGGAGGAASRGSRK
jgi:hypothetical protein